MYAPGCSHSVIKRERLLAGLVIQDFSWHRVRDAKVATHTQQLFSDAALGDMTVCGLERTYSESPPP